MPRMLTGLFPNARAYRSDRPDYVNPNQPGGVAVDKQGRIFVADQTFGNIMIINADKTITNFAGLAGSSEEKDGVGSDARFSAPSPMVFENATGDMFVADWGSEALRRVTPEGSVTSVIPGRKTMRWSLNNSDKLGDIDGPLTQARLGMILNLCIDTPHNVMYITSKSWGAAMTGRVRMLSNIASGENMVLTTIAEFPYDAYGLDFDQRSQILTSLGLQSFSASI